MPTDYEIKVHEEWLGMVQPRGLVVSPVALAQAQAFVDKNITAVQTALINLVVPPAGKTSPKGLSPKPHLSGFLPLAHQVLGWKPGILLGESTTHPVPDSLRIPLPELHETLCPTYALRAPSDHGAEFLLLILELAATASPDRPTETAQSRWTASPQARFERLLRETGVPIGILSHPDFIRLVYAPRGESSGFITWPIRAMTEVAGRPLLSALVMLLGSARLFTLPKNLGLPHILRESRKYQNEVSIQLADQVLDALFELLRGFGHLEDRAQAQRLQSLAHEQPDHVYGGLLAVMLRLVFLLYAEEKELLPSSPLFVRHYALSGLFESLTADAMRHPDSMDDRYGAWSRLLVLFRMIHDGAHHGDLVLPPRYGHLFDPDGWEFLEGRPRGVRRSLGQAVAVPPISDGVIYRVLQKLLVLNGQRLSYRALDVEQIGSVYENMMGYDVRVAAEPSVAIGPKRVVVGLESLLAVPGGKRAEWLEKETDVKISGKDAVALNVATSVDGLVGALGRRVSQPVIAVGGLYLQPTEERRRSGSHYTPRELTAPVVQRALEPVFLSLGPTASAQQWLAVKVCDPAMGSGAFLVECCRQLGEKLAEVYDREGWPETLKPEDDKLLFAMREVAGRCLYGVDKNPFAVDLGKLSLWLVTLAKQHAFTFLDHSIRHGDSLVGMSLEQIKRVHWKQEDQLPLVRQLVDKAVSEAVGLRNQIAALSASDDTRTKRDLLQRVEDAVDKVRRAGDVAVAAFFGATKDKERLALQQRWQTKVETWLSKGDYAVEIEEWVAQLRQGEKPVVPFHWELEFPEVFHRNRGGFDAMVGNPPFAGKNNLLNGHREGMLDWLKTIHPESHGNADLVAHFFRRVFDLLRPDGVFGLIATNTIAQGDTRSMGLRWICTHGGELFAAETRRKWPGRAAVIVSVVHGKKGKVQTERWLDGRKVHKITAYLVDHGEHDDPVRLKENEGLSFIGSYVLGMGFTFDDTSKDATPIAEMERLIRENPHNRERIFPYIGGEEVNTSPKHEHHRYVIHFGDLSESQAREGWPELMEIVERKVKPERMVLNNTADGKRLKQYWWQWGRDRPALHAAIRGLERVIVISRVGQYMLFTFLPMDMVYSEGLVVIASPHYSALAALQSRVHEVWARIFRSSMKDDPRYTPSDCFETFPFPPNWQTHPVLETVGQQYHDFRAQLLLRDQIGLTTLYNRFHDREDESPDIVELRRLHGELDRAMLDAYGWTDLHPQPEFLLEYEEGNAPPADGRPQKRAKKKPWRYRWNEQDNQRVFARLLELNQQRAKGQTATAQLLPPQPKVRASKPTPENQGRLF